MEKFVKLYDNLDVTRKKALRKKIIDETDMSYPTFYYKLQKNSFSKLERERIAEIVGKPVDELFPESDSNISYQ